MRTVTAFLRNASLEEVRAHLDACFPGQRDPWLVTVDREPCLYINTETDLAAFGLTEDAELRALGDALGGGCSLVVSADVSGRHSGDEQVRQFARAVLSRFSGVFSDEYSNMFWTLADIEAGSKRGLRFFSPG